MIAACSTVVKSWSPTTIKVGAGDSGELLVGPALEGGGRVGQRREELVEVLGMRGQPLVGLGELAEGGAEVLVVENLLVDVVVGADAWDTADHLLESARLC